MNTGTSTVGHPVEAGPFGHLGLLYDGPAEYLSGTLPFLQAALAADEPALVAVPQANVDLIRDALDGDAGRLAFADMTVAGRNPGRIIPGVLLAFAAAHAGRRVAIIGEPIWPGRSVVEYPACAAHEALINAAFAGRNAAILCPYDAKALDQQTVADAHRTHPVMTRNGSRWDSAFYVDPLATAATFNQPVPTPPPHAVTLAYRGQTSLADVRRFVTGRAAAAGLEANRTAELAIAVNELAANTVEHGGGGGQVTVWAEPGTLVCQVHDTGHLTDPLAGRIPVAATQLRGRGLVLVNQLCDLVRVHTQPGGTTIHVQVGM
jgi:anti-sigma regulatory factor (Ser/Thr protein kinase)